MHPGISPRKHVVSLFLSFAFFLNLAMAGSSYAQSGVATGNGVATPAKPLPPGIKPPVVGYKDIALQAGLTSFNVSGAEQNKQYIVETTGTRVAIFDYHNDARPDILFVTGG